MKIGRKYLSSKIRNVNFYFKHILLQTIYITITQYIVDKVIYKKNQKALATISLKLDKAIPLKCLL